MNLETLLQKYISEVLGGNHDSSIRSASIIPSLSSTDQRAWTQVRPELQVVGITPQQFDENREKIIATFQQAFGLLSPTVASLQPSKKASQISRILAFITPKNKDLLIASNLGDLSGIKKALQENADVNVQTKGGRTALMIAVGHGYTELVELLLQHRADVNRMSKYDYTALHEAVESGQFTIAKILLEHCANVDSKSEHGKSPLLLAVLGRQLDLVRLLLEHKASTGLRSDYCDPDPISRPIQRSATFDRRWDAIS